MSSVNGTVIFLVDCLKCFSLNTWRNLRLISEMFFPSKLTIYNKKKTVI